MNYDDNILYSDLDRLLINGDNEITCNYELYNIIKNKYDIADKYEIIYNSIESDHKELTVE